MNHPTAETVVQSFFAHLNTGDLEQIRRYLTPETVWRPMVKGMTAQSEYRGSAIIDDFLGPIRGPDGLFAPGDPKVTVTSLVANDTQVAAETAGAGQLRDGRRYENRYAWFFAVKGNKILRIHEYLDSLYVSQLISPGKA